MLLKKQTVWLLTMLSLVIVLSVYYMTSPQESQYTSVDQETEGASLEHTENDGGEVVVAKDDEEASAEEGAEDASANEEDIFFSNVGSNEELTTMRLELNEQRSRQIEEYEEQVAAEDLTSQERSEAYDEVLELRNLESKESIIETRLRQEGFTDALVRVAGDDVNVTVISEEQSKTLANQVMATVRDELGQNTFAVVEMKPAE
ncbi:SpoIIIAH-like family protein [Bacillaceae bacterium SIJ1]|uniref:SpoIIIAH-like family protein n=1 Tax=Litoribacterium kuwaitense TaxID=1398745 RepID=UPI0013EA3D5F|nr:SpoIIIAH-like family protein [Litoribacterium kuwaitense]NGP43604.1 SpoIIIAH-like family protein [Litoribacterium kuwaitense]